MLINLFKSVAFGASGHIPALQELGELAGLHTPLGYVSLLSWAAYYVEETRRREDI